MERTRRLTDHEQRASRVAAQAPLTCALFVATALLSGVCEWWTFPNRVPAMIVFQVALIGAAALCLHRIRRRPEHAVGVMRRPVALPRQG